MFNVISKLRIAAKETAFINAAQKEGTIPSRRVADNGKRMYSWMNTEGKQIIESLDKKGRPVKSVQKTVVPNVTRPGRFKIYTDVFEHKSKTHTEIKLNECDYGNINSLSKKVTKKSRGKKDVSMDKYYFENKKLLVHYNPIDK